MKLSKPTLTPFERIKQTRNKKCHPKIKERMTTALCGCYIWASVEQGSVCVCGRERANKACEYHIPIRLKPLYPIVSTRRCKFRQRHMQTDEHTHILHWIYILTSTYRWITDTINADITTAIHIFMCCDVAIGLTMNMRRACWTGQPIWCLFGLFTFALTITELKYTQHVNTVHRAHRVARLLNISQRI